MNKNNKEKRIIGYKHIDYKNGIIEFGPTLSKKIGKNKISILVFLGDNYKDQNYDGSINDEFNDYDDINYNKFDYIHIHNMAVKHFIDLKEDVEFDFNYDEFNKISNELQGRLNSERGIRIMKYDKKLIAMFIKDHKIKYHFLTEANFINRKEVYEFSKDEITDDFREKINKLFDRDYTALFFY